MSSANRTGLALLIMGVISAQGAVLGSAVFWYIGLALGFIGMILMFRDTKEDR